MSSQGPGLTAQLLPRAQLGPCHQARSQALQPYRQALCSGICKQDSLHLRPGLHARRPSFVVRTTQRNPFRSSLSEHLTGGYRASLMAVCLAQLGSKAVPGGLHVSALLPCS